MNSVTDISQTQMEKTLAGFQIPCEPSILSDIRKEQSKPEPNMQSIAKMITKDVAMSAAILKTINSPFFGLRRKIDAIPNAVMLLGIQNIATFVTAFSLKNIVMRCKGLSLERYWQSASDVANISMLLAKRFYYSDPDTYYALGLFHDAGIPLLAQKYDNYKEVLVQGNHAIHRSIVEIEDQYYNTNHATIGYYLCKSWRLSDTLACVVAEHHQLDALVKNGAENQNRNQMMAVLKMAGNVSHTFRRANEDNEWSQICSTVLDYFAVTLEEYAELKADIHDILAE